MRGASLTSDDALAHPSPAGRGRRGLIALTLGLLLARAGLGLAAWDPGWVSLTWDDFTRVALALEWAEHPYLAVGDLVWLPLHYWLLGAAYRLLGHWFPANPMALAAAIHTGGIMLAAAFTGWAAWHLFRNRLGALVAFAAVLFSPWGFYLSLSGHNEPLYYTAIALAVWGLAAWTRTDRTLPLFMGAAGVMASSMLRYEGWWLALAWLAVVPWAAAGAEHGWGARLRFLSRRPAVAVAALLPLLGPAAWMGINLLESGDPLAFIDRTRSYFGGGYGAVVAAEPVLRLIFNPLTTLQTAPLLLPLIVLVAVLTWRRYPLTRMVVALIGLQFLLLYGTSLLYPAFGDLAHRYLFGFVVGLGPLLGGLPDTLRRLRPPGLRVVAVIALGALALAVTGYRMRDRPTEWRHDPDFLELNEALGELSALSGSQVRLVAGPGLEYLMLPLRVQNGNRVAAVLASDLPDASPPQPPDGFQLWVERLPARILELPPPEALIGRFHLWGPAASRLPVDHVCCTEAWTRVDEFRHQIPQPPNPYLALEYTSDDPRPWDLAWLTREFPRGPVDDPGEMRLIWLHGRDLNLGRIEIKVLLDDEVLFRTDASRFGSWVTVPFVIPAGEGSSELRVELAAGRWVEPGWGWGRHATVLVEEVRR